MTAPTRVLVVEDSADLLAELLDFLRFSNFDAHGADSLATMNHRLRQESWQVLVLDLGLPDGDGLLAAHDIRARHGLALGVVMMTARGQLEDRVQGLAAGADCYLTKPVALRELKAVIEALLPRLTHAALPLSGSTQPAPGTAALHPATHAGLWLLDRRTLRLHSPGGAQLLLTGTEARLLQGLFEARGEVLGRDALCRALGPAGHVPDTRRLDSLISRLRSKVEQQGGGALPIQTFRNLGYAFGGPCGVGAPAAQEQTLVG